MRSVLNTVIVFILILLAILSSKKRYFIQFLYFVWFRHKLRECEEKHGFFKMAAVTRPLLFGTLQFCLQRSYKHACQKPACCSRFSLLLKLILPVVIIN